MRGVRSDIRAERLAGRRGASWPERGADLRRHGERDLARPAPATRTPSSSPSGFDYLRLQESYLASSAAALRAERIARYQHSSVRFVHTGNLANDVVIFFGFDYCRFKFSRFG